MIKIKVISYEAKGLKCWCETDSFFVLKEFVQYAVDSFKTIEDMWIVIDSKTSTDYIPLTDYIRIRGIKKRTFEERI